MLKSIAIVIRYTLYTVIIGGVGILLYDVYDSNQDRKGAVSACIEAYPNHTQVIGIVGLDLGTLCFDESEDPAVLLGVLDE